MKESETQQLLDSLIQKYISISEYTDTIEINVAKSDLLHLQAILGMELKKKD